MRYLILLPLLLAACAQPVTRVPNVSRDELQMEEFTQDAAHENQRGRADNLRVEEERKKRSRKDSVSKRVQRVFPRVSQAGMRVCNAIMPEKPARECMYYIKLSRKQELNAWADGDTVNITYRMTEFAESDDELALILAHEITHNMLEHQRSQGRNAMVGAVIGALIDGAAATQGYNTNGGFTELGGERGVLQYSTDFEAEADYVGMYILANAGYDYSHVAEFWRRMSMDDADGIYLGATHPTNPERYLAIRKTAAEIDAKRKSGIPLLPEMRGSGK